MISCHWSDLLVVSYRVQDDHVRDLIPPGTEICRLDGSALVSVVGFRFADVRLGPIPAPVPREFAQWNFRTYVTTGDDWGVVFLKEYVPSGIVAQSVRALYGEPYHKAPLTSVVEAKDGTRHVGYALRVENATHTIAVTADADAREIQSDDPGLFHAGSGWGCRKSGSGLARFRVEHPPWRAYDVRSHSVAIDFEAVYADRWGWLRYQEPAHVVLLEGSEVKVGLSRRQTDGR